jgi:hydrogenase maturation protease
MKILIYGIGNPGRQDDALGPMLVELVQQALKAAPAHAGEQGPTHQFSFDANYQLNVEDAEALSRHDVVVFADASRADPPVRLARIEPEPTASFTTHSVSPGGVVALCDQLYAVRPAVYMLAMRGYEWEVNQPLTDNARANLQAAVTLLVDALGTVRTARGGHRAHSPLERFVS